MDGRLSALVLSDDVREKIRQGAQPAPRRRPVRFRRPALIAVAACLVLACGIGVAAGALPGFERFIERMGEDLRTLVQPIAVTSTQQGIRMDVMAAVHDDESAIIYLSLADEEQNRIGPDTELFDLSLGEGTMVHATQVDYDPENETAIFRLEAHLFGGEELHTAAPLTLNVHSILTGVAFHEGVDTGLTVANILAANPKPETVQEPAISGFGVSYGAGENAAAVAAELETQIDSGAMRYLARGSAPLAASAPAWAGLGAAGVIDGYLHLQIEPVSDAGRFGNTHYYLRYPGAPQDTFMDTLTSAEVPRGESFEYGMRQVPEYVEQILELPKNVLPENMQLFVGGASCEEHIEGDWRVTFTLEDRPAQYVSDTGLGIDLNGWQVDSVALSSIGAAAYASGEQSAESDALEMEVYLKNGQMAKT
ncbi:MAG: DUF4179 domain-containing protein, partial [Oscillospiraceae bacterium]